MNEEKTFTLPFVVVSVVTFYRLALSLIILINSAIHFNHYTYWSYIGETVFYVVLWLAYLTRWANVVRALSVFVLPMVFGSAFFVYLYIILVEQLDSGRLLLAATTLGGGSLSLGTVHTFDNLIHTFTVFDLLLVLISGYLTEARIAVRLFQQSLSERAHRILFVVYFFAVPALPFSIYCIFFNPFREYPTPASPAISLSFAAVVYLLIVWFFYAALTRKPYRHFDL